jgi:hypothetical protein
MQIAVQVAQQFSAITPMSSAHLVLLRRHSSSLGVNEVRCLGAVFSFSEKSAMIESRVSP